MRHGEILVLFQLDNNKYALLLSSVDRVVESVKITSLPEVHPYVLGVIDYQTEIIPVLNIRSRFHLGDRGCEPSDHLIIAHTKMRKVALLVDQVEGVTTLSDQIPVAAEKISPTLKYVEGIVQLNDGLVIIHDLETFLSSAEEREMNRLLEKMGATRIERNTVK